MSKIKTKLKEVLENIKTHVCGCVMSRENGVWNISEYCKAHKPNYAKKAEKLIRRKEKKRGRGYTKSWKRNKK